GTLAAAQLDADPDDELVIAGLGTLVAMDLDGTALWSVTTGPSFGGNLLVPGDVDSDGVADVLAGDHLAVPHGAVRLLSGAVGRLVWSDVYAYGVPAYDTAYSTLRYGVGLAALDDRTGDGAPELVASGPQDGTFFVGTEAGAVRVLDGATGGVRVDLREQNQAMRSLHFGAVVASVADVDGDGHRELVVSAPYAPDAAGGPLAGDVAVLSCP
ncbi:MAG: integrin alpha, partial [Myxococcota bacterium]